jgi:iron(III) transport system substrate-binding protein
MRSTGTKALVASLALFAGAATACGGDDGGSAATTTAAATGGTAAGSGASSGGANTDPCGFDQALIDAAKKEGSVNVVGAYFEADAKIVGDIFKEAYDIEFVYNRQPTADAVQQVETALEAGATTVDAAWLAEPSTFVKWTTEGKVVKLDPPNADQFVDGLRDVARYSVPTSTIPMGVLYNSSRVDKEELAGSWKEFLEKRGDKVVALANPSNSGSSLSYHYVLSKELGADYLTTFKGKKNHITESGTTLTQLTLTGEVDFAIPGYESEVVKARKTGEPLEVFYFDEVVPATVTEIGVLTKAPHPNAGKLFAEFLVCETVQNRLKDIGQRPAIKGAPFADGLQDLSSKKIVAPDIPDMIAKRATVTAQFDAATK